MFRKYRISELVPYVNWLYFFHAWGLSPKFASIAKIHDCAVCRANWLSSFCEEEREKAREAANLFREAMQQLAFLEVGYRVSAIVELFDCNSDGDDILIERNSGGSVCLPMLRQQTIDADGYCWCLSDFIRPIGFGVKDRIGVFVTSVDASMQDLFAGDDYRHMLVQTLADRLSEAAAEVLHAEVRKKLWGYAPDEKLTVDEMMVEKYQGIRPAVGYPCMPDVSMNFVFDELIDYSRIGVKLTEHGMMQPHASVSGLMISHPQAKYFSVGKIDDCQLTNYARRRGVGKDEIKKYLNSV